MGKWGNGRTSTYYPTYIPSTINHQPLAINHSRGAGSLSVVENWWAFSESIRNVVEALSWACRRRLVPSEDWFHLCSLVFIWFNYQTITPLRGFKTNAHSFCYHRAPLRGFNHLLPTTYYQTVSLAHRLTVSLWFFLRTFAPHLVRGHCAMSFD